MNLSYRAKHNLAVFSARALSLLIILVGASLMAWGIDRFFPIKYSLPVIFFALVLVEIYERDNLYRSFRRRLIKRGE
jgi:hypothetical protein